MPAKKYSNYLEVNPLFESVVDIDADNRNPDLWHEYIVGDDKHHNLECIVASSFIGSDPYAEGLYLSSKASAQILEFDPIYGHVGTKTIILN